MEVNIFDNTIEIFQHQDEFPPVGKCVIFKRKGSNRIDAGVVYYYTTRCPKIRVNGTRTSYVEFHNLEWWGIMK